MANSKTQLVGKLSLDTPSGNLLGDKRIRLLEAIELYGSLNRAAKEVPLSYKAAWDALDAMNNLAEAPLVISNTGGQHGGGSQLTDYGRRMVMLYRAMENVYQDALDHLSPAATREIPAQDTQALRTLIKRMSIKTSARNQFVGVVASMDNAGGMVNVRVRLDHQDEIVAAVTMESVENMGLCIGAEVFALTKAPWVSVSNKPQRVTTGRNILAGLLTRLDAGVRTTELSVTTQSGRIVTAVMNNAVVEKSGLALSLKKKQAVWATFAASSVILATYR